MIDLKFQNDIAVASQFIKRTYLNDLSKYEVVPLEEHQKKFQSIRLYKVTKLTYDKNEDINDKLISVFNSVQNTSSNLIFMLHGQKDFVDFYIGVQSTREIGVADKVFYKSIIGNFPGSSVTKISQADVGELLNNVTEFGEHSENLTCLNVIPSNRNKEDFVQGIEKYIDTMRGENYVCMLIASSVSDEECEVRLNGYEQLYSTLYPLSNLTMSHGTTEGATITEGINSSVSNSVSDSIAKTTGTNKSDTNTVGFNAGFLGLGGINVSSAKTNGTSQSESVTSSTSSQETTGYSSSVSKNESVTDNISVNYKDKMIEDSLEHIERKIDRIKECMTFGMWECAAYFMSDDIQTSVVAANAFRSLMLGEDNLNEKSHLNIFGMRERLSTATAIETIKYCRHPVFKINALNSQQHITATEYLSGKELPLMFSLPRKSVAGVAVSSVAEFGRNIVYINDNYNTSDRQTLDIGRISHMNNVEDTPVKLDLQSLSSHCFITGSTGSGKSNTTFTIIDELIKPENNIPFLVVEPAKGEYKYAFTNVPGINIFTTGTAYGRFLKLNPFKFQPAIHVLEHIDRLIEIFNTCWEMYAAMPAILKDAIERMYEKCGWDLINSVYVPGGVPKYPNFRDLLAELPAVINSSGYSSDTKGDYIGALVTRVNSLTNGISGQIFCDCYDLDDEVIFDMNTIVDLSRVGSAETKSLIMGIIVLRLTEYRMASVKATNSPLRHITILEEAHNLLKNSKNAGGAQSALISKSVEMICNSIAEMRTYGEGFILVDQSPTSVDIAAIKNTNTKIIMRLPEASDCEAVGRSVSLDEKQILELSKLRTGSAVVMQNNWSDAVLTQINRYEYKYQGEINYVSGDELLKFKSVVLSELLNEYVIGNTKSVNKILEKIESFDIDRYKKDDSACLVKTICNSLDRKWDSLFLGKALASHIGADAMFRRAERSIRNLPLCNKEHTEKDRESVARLFDYIKNDVSNSVALLNERERNSLIQYITYAKVYESNVFDYDWIYRTRYIK